MTETVDFRELAKVVRENTKPEQIGIKKGGVDESSVLLVPNGMEPYSLKRYLDEYKEKPDRRKGTIKLDRLSSFVDICNRFKNENSVLFASASIGRDSINARINAVFDYHPANGDVKDADNADHGALYKFPTSKDFDFWISNNGKAMSQLDFALFLEERHIEMSVASEEEENIINGLKPKFADPLEMLELSKDLEIYSNENFKSKNKLSSGETEIKFTTEHHVVDAVGKPISIPDFFVIQVPVFEGGNVLRIIVRLRYRLKDGKVVWFYDLYRIDQVLNDAFESGCAVVAETTQLPLFFGESE